ncbi:HIT domain-containing protein [Streptomyces sp. NPDC045456]|uniref:HIT family protein n=1 Tax=Streptomyces sp. NPDC045456 TaxID=3155254 RepID=UPI0033D4249A
MFITDTDRRAERAAAGGGPETMTHDQFERLRELAELRRESDRLRIATAARTRFEDIVARHDELQKEGTDPREFAEVREEAAAYLSGRRPVPPPVRPAELIAHARRRIEVFGLLAADGIEEAVEGVAEAEAELAELHKARPGCVFCSIAAGTAPATFVREWEDVIAIRPHGGVNDGHVLVIPRVHVADAGVDRTVTERTVGYASLLFGELDAGNMITSKGRAATQTQFHLHVHVIPRVMGDGLPLPWTPQQKGVACACMAAGGAR